MNIIVITGMSGSGKTTAATYILHNFQYIKVVTCTTRNKRNRENNNDYKFLTRHEFEDQIDQRNMLEYVESFGNYYGINKHDIDFHKGNYIVCLDHRGATTIKNIYKNNAYVILMQIQDIDVIYQRIIKRDKIDSTELKLRVSESKQYNQNNDLKYDYIIDAQQKLEDMYICLNNCMHDISIKNAIKNKSNIFI